MSALSTSPPKLPIPRQPSPLSFSSRSGVDPPSPLLSSINNQSSVPSSQRSSVTLPPSARDIIPPSQSFSSPSPAVPTRQDEDRFPVDPLPDSLLLRSTFDALDHSASILKRMSKSVLAASRAYLTLLEQVERAEEELFLRLGELGRWLESGYGLNGDSVWDDGTGIKKVRKDARKREREEIEVMIEHSVRTVKGELKRNGLGGLGAQSRFETSAKQFYQQTSDYLAPQSNGAAAPHGQMSSAAPQSPTLASHDLAQASRLAQFDLARYAHHSTLLYAVPPTSIACVDLLAGLYSWINGLIGDVPESREASLGREGSEITQNTRDHAGSTTGNGSASTPLNPKILKATLSVSLERLASIRSALLADWGRRDIQSTQLEDAAAERQAEVEGGTLAELPTSPKSPRWGEQYMAQSSSSFDHRKGQKKMHKLHRSVGGKLRELLSSSGSSRDLVVGDRSERSSRMSIDSGQTSRPVSIVTSSPAEQAVVSPTSADVPNTQTPQSSPAVPNAVRRPSATWIRPAIQPRHSMYATRTQEYVSPFIASQAADLLLPFERSPDLSLSPKLENTPVSGSKPRLGGVGGLGAGGDEDEKREEVGRKKEGVLWGAGVWEDLTQTPAKAKWENFWVVLDHSSIYEYRDRNLGKLESAHAVIDLKFASVREGRGTDRRFVFEIVTPTKGRRLYQATSEVEMKQWLYAICNAIESCINGTSSVRTFDTSKLRTPSGSFDDHALPKPSLFPVPSRGLGIGFLGARRSMPPAKAAADEGDRRSRKTSLKKVIRQSAEIAGEKWSHVMNRTASGTDMPRPGLLGQTGRIPSKASTTPSIDEVPRPTSAILRTSAVGSESTDGSAFLAAASPTVADDIEKRVLEMAGLGLGAGLSSGIGTMGSRRVMSGGLSTNPSHDGTPPGPQFDISRTRSGETPPLPELEEPFQVDMALLRHVADLPANRLCADCGKSMKSSRWASISLREVPMVIFLCIRCVGVHRSLGVHISKPRSVDLDIWTPESILSAKEWGNERANRIWKATMPVGRVATDEGMADHIRAKYVEGRWLDEEGRRLMGLDSTPILRLSPKVGRAL